MSSGADLQCNTKMNCKELVQLMWDPIYMYYSELLFGKVPAVDPWRRGAGRSCRKAVHQKREDYFVYALDITTFCSPYYLCAGCKPFTAGIDFLLV